MAIAKTTQGTALAGGAIVGSLLQTLVKKGALTNAEVGDLLIAARQGLGPHLQSPEGFDASQMITNMLSRFPRESK
jgi:hypothetical protein